MRAHGRAMTPTKSTSEVLLAFPTVHKSSVEKETEQPGDWLPLSRFLHSVTACRLLNIGMS